MASYTENILLTLRGQSDPVEVESFNRDNEIIDELLAPVAVDYAVVRSAARINSYNVMKAIRAVSYGGIDVPEKNAMFFGDFDSEAYAASEDALHCTEKHGYMFSVSKGSSFANGNAGDVGTEMNKGAAFSFEAPISGYITAIEVDVKATNGASNCYIRELIVGDSAKKTITIGQMTGTRSTLTYTFSTPVAVHKGDIISGTLRTGSDGYYGEAYGAVLGEPYVKFSCTPATQTGWIQTEIEPLGSMGHNETRTYIQCLKDENGKIRASLIDEAGNEVELEQVGSRTTVTKDGNTCVELCFTAPFAKEAAALKICVDAGNGYADIYNYAVTVL
ncbi:MAG: hypothetical protein E7430_09480 [Ruminococcaceae bacterium]|nr:hypothetical protein [Oscillospiraceae bacterium]